MHGTLDEIDIRSILQLIELGQRTGQLLVEARVGPAIDEDWFAPKDPPPRHEDRSWFVFFINGQIAYAADNSHGGLQRLRDYLHPYQAESALEDLKRSALPLPSTNTTEYAYLWLLLENYALTPTQGRQILHKLAAEALFDLLGLHQGAFTFEQDSPLEPPLATLEISPLLSKCVKQVQQWKQFHPHLQALDQRPIVVEEVKLRDAMTEAAYQRFARTCDGKTSLRRLARHLDRDPIAIAKILYPYVQRGWVQMLSPAPSKRAAKRRADPASDRAPHIVCIDDDLTICRSVEFGLRQQGYQVTAIADPLRALGEVFEILPDLIFCDLAMPGIDGYEICAMLRSATVFRQTPIVVLTGKEGFIDRVKAKLVRASDYLTKPFGDRELLMLVEKYLGARTASEQ